MQSHQRYQCTPNRLCCSGCCLVLPGALTSDRTALHQELSIRDRADHTACIAHSGAPNRVCRVGLQVQYFARAFQQMRNTFLNTVVAVIRDVRWFLLLLLVRYSNASLVAVLRFRGQSRYRYVFVISFSL